MNATFLKSKETPSVAAITSIFVNMDTDILLLKRIQKGDEHAFEEIFNNYYLRLCHFAYQYLHNMPDAEGLVQDTFVNIWEKRSSIDINASFKSYLYQSVKNRCLNSLRGNQRREKHQSQHQARQEYTGKTDDNLHINELNEKLFQGLESLPPKCKKIFQMSRLEGLKHKEIASKMEIKVKTVENQIGIALKHLRQHLADYLKSIAILCTILNF